jgi:molybdenum cofactor cytidylyltransferase
MIVGILLAAGQATRFGSDKLAHPLPDGTPLIQAAARNLRLATDHVIVVLRPDQPTLLDLLGTEDVEIVECVAAAGGMGHSLACGVSAAPAASGWLIALADMPLIRPDTIRQAADLLRAGASIVAPQHHGQRGHPVGFQQAHFPALSALGGDSGARDLLARHAAELQLFACDDPGVLLDIDTPADLSRMPLGSGI